MKVATWDSGLRWGDKNLRWGEPSVLLQENDPGWVADPASASYPQQPQPKRTKAMARQPNIERKDTEFSAQMLHFKNTVGAYAATVGLSAQDVTNQAQDADYFAHVLACQEIADTHAQQRTAWKNLVRKGGEGNIAGEPEEPVWPAAVPPVAPGVEKRFRQICEKVKKSLNYNTGIGEALDIEGDVISAPDMASFKPVFTLKVQGGQVVVDWGWLGKRQFLSSIEILVNRGSGWELLTIDTTAGYVDSQPLPASAQKWAYKAIYRSGDARVGQWSDEASITVGG